MFTRRFIIASMLIISATFSAGLPWEKTPSQWTLGDVFRILQDSPWNPSKFSVEANYSQRHTDPQSGVVTDAQTNPQNTGPVPGVAFQKSHALPPVTVLWWSSKTIRLAEAKRLASKPGVKHPAEDLEMPELPDYVLSVEGDEPLRILRDAREDLHDTIFLELENGGTLDLASVKFVEDGDTDVVRTEVHFARLLNGEPAIDPESERVIFHCRANAKKEIPGRASALSFRVEFSPKAMKALGQSDL